jgi:hypothetical protein
MYSKPNWAVSEWGSQVVDANNTVILTAPDFISPYESKHVKANILLASHAPEMLELIRTLLNNELINNEIGKRMAEEVSEKIFSKLENLKFS